MGLALFIAKRYTLANKSNNFFSFIPAVSVIGISLGVAVLIIVLSVMNGFETELKQRILGAIPHASLHAREPLVNWQQTIDDLQQHDQVEAAAPFVNIQGMLSSSFGVQGVMVNGIDPQYETKVSIVNQHMLSGVLTSLKSKSYAIVLGDILAAQLGVSIGDKLIFILPHTSYQLWE